ncbi:hypothetical protein RCL1_006288 [Eukaryota sp. TZLM3-RCL]
MKPPFSFVQLVHDFISNPSSEDDFLKIFPSLVETYFNGELFPSVEDDVPQPVSSIETYDTDSSIEILAEEEIPIDISSDEDVIEVIEQRPPSLPPPSSPLPLSPSPQYTPCRTLTLNDVRGLSSIMRTRSSLFVPTELQQAVLTHMRYVREEQDYSVGLLVLATALGKTIISILDLDYELEFIEISLNSRINCEYPLVNWTQNRQSNLIGRAKFRVLYLVHSVVILQSALAKFQRHFKSKFVKFSDENFAVVTSDSSVRTDISTIEQSVFVFCLWQSLSSIPPSFLQSITHLIVDEVHHVVAPTFLGALQNIRSNCQNLVYELGLTATLTHRDDPNGNILREIFRNNIYAELSWVAAIELNVFPKVEYFEFIPGIVNEKVVYRNIIQPLKSVDFVDANSDRRHVIFERFLINLKNSLKILNLAFPQSVRAKISPKFIVNVIRKFQNNRISQNLEPRSKCLLFVRNIQECDLIANMLNNYNLPAFPLHSKSTVPLNIVLNNFNSGRIKYLVTVGMVLEGFDLPSVDCLILARLTQSEIVFTQMLGRGLRKSSENDCLSVLDLTLSLRRRWARLEEEISRESLVSQAVSFWDVDTIGVRGSKRGGTSRSTGNVINLD